MEEDLEGLIDGESADRGRARTFIHALNKIVNNPSIAILPSLLDLL